MMSVLYITILPSPSLFFLKDIYRNVHFIVFWSISVWFNVWRAVKKIQQKVDEVVQVQIDPWYLRITFEVDDLLQQAGASKLGWPPG